jgi:putative transposase
MCSAVKIALKVAEGQSTILDGQSKIANWLYNQLLERANGLRQQYRQSQDKEVGRMLYTERGLRDLIPELKARYPFLKTVYSSVLKNAALRLSKAIRDYQDRKHGRRKNVVNWPTFRAWKRNWFSLQYEEPWKGYALIGRTLRLVLGQDARGKQLRIELQLAEALPHWVNHEHIRQCRIVMNPGIECRGLEQGSPRFKPET